MLTGRSNPAFSPADSPSSLSFPLPFSLRPSWSPPEAATAGSALLAIVWVVLYNFTLWIRSLRPCQGGQDDLPGLFCAGLGLFRALRAAQIGTVPCIIFSVSTALILHAQSGRKYLGEWRPAAVAPTAVTCRAHRLTVVQQRRQPVKHEARAHAARELARVRGVHGSAGRATACTQW